MNKNIACIILAAGKGERMNSALPKALHPICARPMLDYVLDLAADLKINKIVCVLGHKHAEVRKILKPGIKTVLQKKLLGTADAIKAAMPALKNFSGTVLVLYTDIPLLKKESIDKLLKHHIENKLDATILTAHLDKPQGYGRILRDKYSSVCGIVEEKDADDFQKDIKEINTGIICFNKESLSQALRLVARKNQKKEYYLTDTVAILYKKGKLIDAKRLADINEALGINSRVDLMRANAIMQKRLNEEYAKKGISIIDSDTTFIGYGAKIGQDTTIYPFTVIERDVTIGKRCFIGPFAHLRQGTHIASGVMVGNFTEVTRAKIGRNTLAKHFCYLADAKIGKNVNIGAGTVTANFDGKNKHTTIIKDNAFIGSDTVLVAPVKIGRRALTGAGSVVTKNKVVADGITVVGVPARELKLKKR